MTKKKKILLVDDENDMIFVVKMELEANGYEVLTAANGQDGLDMARREMPDLIVLDLMLPKVDGYKVCRILKFDEKYKKIPVIIFTARGQKDDERIGKEVGADAFIVKPFESNVLLGKIAELIKETK